PPAHRAEGRGDARAPRRGARRLAGAGERQGHDGRGPRLRGPRRGHRGARGGAPREGGMSDARNEPPGPAPGAGPAPRAESEAERSFFSGEGAAEADAAPPPRRRSRFLARNPVFAAVALAACGWLAFDLAPDVLYFFSSRTPV